MTSLPISFSWANQNRALLPGEGSNRICCSPATPLQALIELQRLLPAGCELEVLSETDFEKKLLLRYQQESTDAQKMMEDLGSELDFYSLAEELPAQEDLLDEQNDAPIIRLINAMLSEAIKVRASDVHIETYETSLVIRFRIDGELKTVLTPQRQLAALLVSRIKVMSKLDIAEKRIPQDGRITLKVAGRAIDVRVSVLPASRGERVVMRLLDKESVSLDLTQSGMSPDTLALMLRLAQQPHGIILVTGPTGSGKSTTLYSLLNAINDGNRNIMTIEDPVEFELNGISQTQVNPRVDMTFARGLRALLRQDPDVVLIGEIRDNETAQIAVQASLTGHLVLSTLHTNTAAGTLTRLRDMGVEPYLLASSLTGVLAQRLLRKLCLHCREPYTLSEAQCRVLKLAERNVTAWRATGCPACQERGYQGRLAIHELLVIDDAVREAIYQQESEAGIEKVINDRRHSLRQDAIRKLLSGETTFEEVVRATGEDHQDEV